MAGQIAFTITQEKLFSGLQQLIGVVDRKQTLEIISHLLFCLEKDGRLKILATDTQLELATFLKAEQTLQAGNITLPARKLFDICRTLPPESLLKITADEKRARIQVLKSKVRFSLLVLDPLEFPTLKAESSIIHFDLTQKKMKLLLEKTYFSMAQQDVRIYLKGLLFEIQDGEVRTVGSNAHRLSVCCIEARDVQLKAVERVILPRKTVLELLKLLNDEDTAVRITLSKMHATFNTKKVLLTSKLIDSNFPDHRRFIPSKVIKKLRVDREAFKQALHRVSILSNEKLHGMRLALQPGCLKLSAHNAEQELAEEELEVDYQGASLNLGFNVFYLIEALNTLPEGPVELSFGEENNCALLRSPSNEGLLFLIMPLRL